MSEPSVTFEKGALSVETLAACFDAVPANVCFIDADRIVRYVSRYAVFSGYSPEIVGTDVLDCHSEATYERITEMLDAFAAGSRDTDGHMAEKRGRKVRVAYRAVRDRAGSYLGCLEVAYYLDGDD